MKSKLKMILKKLRYSNAEIIPVCICMVMLKQENVPPNSNSYWL